MRVTMLGNFLPAHSTENHLAQTLVEMGHRVTFAQENEVAASRPNWNRFIEACGGRDLVMYVRTWGIPRDRAADLWQGLAAHDIRTVSYHLDLFIGLERERLVANRDPLFMSSLVCTADGDHDADWARYGVNHRWIRPGVLRAECRPGARSARWEGYDVAFVGSSDRYHAEWPYRQELLAFLRATYGDRLLVVPKPGQPAVRGQDLNDLYATVPVIVGDTLALNREKARYWSDRVYETTGRGGFLVMPWIDALADEVAAWVPSIDWYRFGDWAGLRATVDARVAEFRHNWAVREDMVAAGSAWVREHASYTNRMEEMLSHLGLRCSA